AVLRGAAPPAGVDRPLRGPVEVAEPPRPGLEEALLERLGQALAPRDDQPQARAVARLHLVEQQGELRGDDLEDRDPVLVDEALDRRGVPGEARLAAEHDAPAEDERPEQLPDDDVE